MDKTVSQMGHIQEMLANLSGNAVEEVKDFIAFLLEKERKKKAFEERVLKIEQDSDTITFKSPDAAMKAIREWSE